MRPVLVMLHGDIQVYFSGGRLEAQNCRFGVLTRFLALFYG
jgi:hypothetical protein